jgi:hypothetical protein
MSTSLARRVLEILQWQSSQSVESPKICPMCHQENIEGHDPSCSLAAALKEQGGEPKISMDTAA